MSREKVSDRGEHAEIPRSSLRKNNKIQTRDELLVIAQGAAILGVDDGAHLVVVEVVVLHVPGLGHHPVHPVGDAAGDALGEGAAVEASGDDAALGLHGVVAAVADVVADHGPAGADGGGHHERRDGVDATDDVERGGEEGGGEHHGEAAEVEQVGPGEDLVQVVDVILVDVLLELLLELADLGAPGGEVEVLAPLAGLAVDVTGVRGWAWRSRRGPGARRGGR